MRATTAYFVGAGTIVAAIAIGLGGGIVAGNIMSPIPPKQGPDTRLERRAASPETPSPETRSSAWNQPAKRIPYVAGSQAMIEVLDHPAQPESMDTTGTIAPATQPQASALAETPNETRTATGRSAEPTAPAASSEREPANAYAKASDSDVKRAAAEQRRAERRRHWAGRRHEMREPRDARGRTDWNDVARNVREDSASRDWASGPRGFPQIRLFGPDDD